MARIGHLPCQTCSTLHLRCALPSPVASDHHRGKDVGVLRVRVVWHSDNAESRPAPSLRRGVSSMVGGFAPRTRLRAASRCRGRAAVWGRSRLSHLPYGLRSPVPSRSGKRRLRSGPHLGPGDLASPAERKPSGRRGLVSSSVSCSVSPVRCSGSGSGRIGYRPMPRRAGRARRATRDPPARPCAMSVK